MLYEVITNKMAKFTDLNNKVEEDKDRDIQEILNAKEFGKVDNLVSSGDDVAVGEGNSPIDFA